MHTNIYNAKSKLFNLNSKCDFLYYLPKLLMGIGTGKSTKDAIFPLQSL